MASTKKTPRGNIKLDSITPKDAPSVEKTGAEEIADGVSSVKDSLIKKGRKWGLVGAVVGAALVAIGYLTPKATERDTEVTGRSDTKPQKLDDNAPAALREELRREAERLNKMEKEKSSALPPTQQFAEVSASVESPYEIRQVVAPAVTPPRPSGMG